MAAKIRQSSWIHLPGCGGQPEGAFCEHCGQSSEDVDCPGLLHLQKRPGLVSTAYDDLFSIRKLEDESLQSLMNRVDTAIHRIQDLRPKDFTLTNLDDELATMTLIRALPDEFSGFASSLLLLDKLEKATIQQAFVSEESQRRHRASATPNVASALGSNLISHSCILYS